MVIFIIIYRLDLVDADAQPQAANNTQVDDKYLMDDVWW